MTSKVKAALKKLKSEVKKARLVAVSKYVSIEDVKEAYNLGQLDFGENRVQELIEKATSFQNLGLEKVRWHFIGHLQTNKVRELLKVPRLWAIHSVDSIRLLEELLKRENDFKGDELKIFFQVKTSSEEEKSGFESEEELAQAIQMINSKKGTKFKVYGLMTMGPIRTDYFEEAAVRSFELLKKIRDEISSRFAIKDLKLSMGMSRDYKLALDAGADFIRVGSLIFKPNLQEQTKNGVIGHEH